LADEKDVDDGFTVVHSNRKQKQIEATVKVKQVDLESISTGVNSKFHIPPNTQFDLANKLDTADGFTIVRSKQKQKPKPLSVVHIRRAPLDPTKTNGSPYHPDFAHIRSPSDVLFKTSDGVLFLFSLSLLSHHSPRFALFDPETLWLRRQPEDFSSVINIAAVDSRAFAIIAHTLLHHYAGIQKELHLEDTGAGNMPSAITELGVVGALRQAMNFAKTLGIHSFNSTISSLIATHAEGLLLLQIYLDYDTGWQIKQLLGL
jgi:hypothetical protein